MITFVMNGNKKIRIMRDGTQVGQIFAPASTIKEQNSIQVCGFNEAFDYWACGVYQGFKDIQLTFEYKPMAGKFEVNLTNGCDRCYHSPCQCEEKDRKKVPFIVKKTASGILKNDDRKICAECGFDMELEREPVILENNIVSLMCDRDRRCSICGHIKDGSNIIRK